MKEYLLSDFLKYPWSSALQSSECETITLNIMRMLKRTGNTFRKLTIEEYRIEREKDGNWSGLEIPYFNKVIDFCVSSDTAILFPKYWSDVVKESGGK